MMTWDTHRSCGAEWVSWGGWGHGGIGFMEEYDLQLWTRRAKVAELKYGTSSLYRETFAASMGLA